MSRMPIRWGLALLAVAAALPPSLSSPAAMASPNLADEVHNGPVTSAKTSDFPSYTWQPLTVPPDATACAARAASAKGYQVIIACTGTDNTYAYVIRGGYPRALATKAGFATFKSIQPQVVSDSGWVYGVVGNSSSPGGAGWQLARWTPIGNLELAPDTPQTTTHQNIAKVFDASFAAHAVAVNGRGDAVINVTPAQGPASSSWVWNVDNSTAAIKPGYFSARTEGRSIDDAGTVYYNDTNSFSDGRTRPGPARRAADGVVAQFPGLAKGFTTEMMAASPSGLRVVGAATSLEGDVRTWVRWDAPLLGAVANGHAPTPTTTITNVNDQGDYLAGTTLVRGDATAEVTSLITANKPEGTFVLSALTEDGSILAHTVNPDTGEAREVGWLIPTP